MHFWCCSNVSVSKQTISKKAGVNQISVIKADVQTESGDKSVNFVDSETLYDMALMLERNESTIRTALTSRNIPVVNAKIGTSKGAKTVRLIDSGILYDMAFECHLPKQNNQINVITAQVNTGHGIKLHNLIDFEILYYRAIACPRSSVIGRGFLSKKLQENEKILAIGCSGDWYIHLLLF
jgi:hypothetical protein